MNATPGTPIPGFEVVDVPTEAMKTMAVLLRDPNPIHWDAGAVAGLGMGDRVINQGPTNMAYIVNMLVAWAGAPDAVRSLRVRFLDNVHGGDHVVAGGVVAEVEDGTEGQVALCEVWLDVVGGPRVLSGTATVAISPVASPV